ncbi:uncharacterized protein At4g22758 [Mercurialis annua]|uniref:uncharacterized protein At4g22758 n=1 Tax=Mercurialis annua TaxID=3986 RepID=UPI00215EBF9B|nr:uncharacterized protein At4g22758 [Mercurialis annua]
MPTTPKSNIRRGQEPEKNRKNKLKEKASSFHGKLPMEVPESRLRRPNTVPDLLGGRSMSAGASFTEARPKLTKLLLNVTVQGSVGAVQVLMSPESTVGELITATMKQYMKEGRRPIISADASEFDLHYSQFSLESLDREEKLMALGSRNFFLCATKTAVYDGASCSISINNAAITTSSCSNEVQKAVKTAGSSWLKFIDFLL